MKKHQTNMFSGSNADLPIFSGTPQHASETGFNPQPAQKQLDLGLQASTSLGLVEAAHVAVERLVEYLHSECPDPHDLQRALNALEDALSNYYSQIGDRS